MVRPSANNRPVHMKNTSNNRISVVIPTYERPSRLYATVESVLNQTIEPEEILVVDDGSESKEQNEVLQDLENLPRVQVVQQPNSGPSAARNNGWKRTEAELVAFTDDDCLVPPDWLESLSHGFESNIGAVGGPLVPTEEALNRSVFARLHMHRVEKVYGVPSEPTVGDDSLPMGGTANIAYRRDALVAVNGFDETFPTAAGEDADLQSRVVDAGYDMKYVPIGVEHNDTYDWESFQSRAIRHGSGSYYFRRQRGKERPHWRILVGLLAAPFFLGYELRRADDISVGIFATIERVLARSGELRAALSD